MTKRRRPSAALLLLLFLSVSCAVMHRGQGYLVVPRAPMYVLRSPNAQETPFTEILQKYNGYFHGAPSIDLRPEMQIRVENAYYEKGYSRKGLKGYLGTEVARYDVAADGLRLLSVVPMTGRPASDLPVQDLVTAAQMKYQYYRLYYEVLYDKKQDVRGSVLLAADSIDELDKLSSQLSDPEAVCGAGATHCTAFPEACSVSVEMQIMVNGNPQMTHWGSLLSSVVTQPPHHLQMKRLYGNHLTAVKIDPQDDLALRLPLLPNDQITWN